MRFIALPSFVKGDAKYAAGYIAYARSTLEEV